MAKITKIPYDTKHEIKTREKFWEEQNKYSYPISIEEVEVGDNNASQGQIEGKVDADLALKAFSDRQRAIATLASAGHNQKEIAKELKLSRRTICSEIAHIRRKISII